MVKRRLFWTAVLILYVAFIFHNSMTPAVESSRQSGKVLTMVLELADRIGMRGQWITEHLIRKAAHFAEYTLLGILLYMTVKQYFFRSRMGSMMQCWLGMAIPFTDETIQLLVEGRSGQIGDVWLDMSGVLAGFLIVKLISGLRGTGRR